MAKKKKGFLPSIEILIILVFLFSFIVWAASQCNETKKLYQDISVEDTATTSTSETNTSNIPDSMSMEITNPQTTTAPTVNAVPTNPAPAPPPKPRSNFAPLYITIDGLKMRTGPSLDSTVILKLDLFDQVNFMGEVTDSTEQINLGYEVADEPWVKVQHKRGKIGWVYGAGVNYYKKKRGGVISE